MAQRIAINGFGRIGRAVLRVLLEQGSELEVVAVNDLTDGATLAHLLEWDSVYGRLRRDIAIEGDELVIDDRRIRVFAEPDPSKLPWGDLGIDAVLEATGRFTKADDARKHLEAGANRVLEYTDEPLVSSDIVGNPHSSIFDSELTQIQGDHVKVVTWYDNEWGFSMRAAEMLARLAAA